VMDFNAGNIQDPWEMLERWDNIPCTCDPDVRPPLRDLP
jgi:hypothetical protein